MSYELPEGPISNLHVPVLSPREHFKKQRFIFEAFPAMFSHWYHPSNVLQDNSEKDLLCQNEQYLKLYFPSSRVS